MHPDQKILLPCTPVSTQGRTPACWAFSMTSYWDTEYYLSHGKWIGLSPWYFMYHKLVDYQQLSFRLGNETHAVLPYGGLGHTALNLLQKYGYATASEYQWGEEVQEKYRNTYRTLKALTYIGRKLPFLQGFVAWLSHKVLDARIPAVPAGHQVDGLDTNLVELTSFAHLPLHQDVVLDLPDNLERLPFYNLSLEELMRSLDYCLENGHSLVWDGGVRGGYVMFNRKKGWAKVRKGVEVTEQLRSEYYQTQLTRDDHMLHIVGRDVDEDGVVYYIAKDSAGESEAYGGYVCLSSDYVRLKTISLIMNKDVFQASLMK